MELLGIPYIIISLNFILLRYIIQNILLENWNSFESDNEIYCNKWRNLRVISVAENPHYQLSNKKGFENQSTNDKLEQQR